ncbi:MAG TPA: glycosyltransferase family 25 protein [Fontimonas sp.]
MAQIPPCYLINLDRCADRLAQMDARLRELGMAYQRVAGVDGLRLSDAEFAQHTRRNAFYKALSRGEVGCYLSHVEVLRRFLADGGDCALVLEDDAILPDELPALLRAAVARRSGERDPDARWDVLKLVRSRRRYVDFGPVTASRNLVEYALSVPAVTTAALWTREAALIWVQAYDGARRPIDCDLQHPWEYGLRIRSLHPPPVDAGVVSAMGGAVRKSRSPWPKLRYEARRLGPKLRHFVAAYGWAGLLRLMFSRVLHRCPRRSAGTARPVPGRG